jgi:small subunit ribosomal protein S5
MFSRGRKNKNDFRKKKDEVQSEWEDKVVSLRRVAKVTRGGKNFRFTALVVVGNKKGKVGFGLGKANELVDAIRKGKDKAIRSAARIILKGNTLPHEVLGRYKGCEILMKPASKGTGVIAGGGVRPVLELVGIHDVLTKSMRSPNPINLVKATFNGLQQLLDIKEIAAKRDKTIAEVFGSFGS